MFHSELAATDYEWVFQFGASNSGPFDDWVCSADLIYTWGILRTSTATGFAISASTSYNFFTASYAYGVTADTPWGSAVPSTGTTFLPAVTVRVYVTAGKLTVHADCTWSLTFSALDIYINFGSGETLFLHVGAESISGSGWDRRKNCSHADGVGTGTWPPTAATCSSTNRSDAVSGSFSVKYRYKDPISLAWLEDVVIVDGTTLPDACDCKADLPALSGTSSYTTGVSGTGTWSNIIDEVGHHAVHCVCPGDPSAYEDLDVFTKRQTSKLQTIWVNIVDEHSIMGAQTIDESQLCSGVDDETSSTITPALTTCESHREVEVFHLELPRCNNYVGPEPPLVCIDGYDCLTAPDVHCHYDGSVTLSWPTAPPCAMGGAALAYDVSNYLRHTRLRSDASNSNLWMGVSHNSAPAVWSDVDTGIAASYARMRFLDAGPSAPIGIIYASAGSLLFSSTPDEGLSFGSPMTLPGTLAAGGFFDFDDGKNGMLHFYWQEGFSAPYTVWYAAFDKQLNLMVGPVATNVTCDLSPIAIRESFIEGAWRSGLEYTLGGMPIWKQARDGINFS